MVFEGSGHAIRHYGIGGKKRRKEDGKYGSHECHSEKVGRVSTVKTNSLLKM